MPGMCSHSATPQNPPVALQQKTVYSEVVSSSLHGWISPLTARSSGLFSGQNAPATMPAFKFA